MLHAIQVHSFWIISLHYLCRASSNVGLVKIYELLRKAGNIPRMGEKIKSHRIFVIKPFSRRPIGRPMNPRILRITLSGILEKSILYNPRLTETDQNRVFVIRSVEPSDFAAVVLTSVMSDSVTCLNVLL